MKKLLVVFLSVALIFVFRTTVMADYSGIYENNGISLSYTEEFESGSMGASVFAMNRDMV